jgi:hypothetical protein
MAAEDPDARARAGAIAAVAVAAATVRRDEALLLVSLEQGIPLAGSASGYVDPSRVLKALVAGTHDRVAIVREASVAGISTLVQATDTTLNGFKLDLRDPDNGLTPLDFSAAQAAVLQRLSDPDARVRALAAGALDGKMSPSAVPILIRALGRVLEERPRDASSFLSVTSVAYNRASNPLPYLCKALVATHDPRAIPALAARDAHYTPTGYCDLCEALYRLGAPERVRHQVLIRREQE